MASLGTWPTAVRVKNCKFIPQVAQLANSSPLGGSEQVFDLLNDRWMVYLTLPVEKFATAAAVEAFLVKLRGMVNTVNFWHFARPQPQGTLRGTLLTSGIQAQGAAQIVLSGGTALGTVLEGDCFGAGGQILMASANATADALGNITIPISGQRLRAAIAAGQSVAWDKPAAAFRLMANSGLTYEAGITSEVSCTFGEAIN